MNIQPIAATQSNAAKAVVIEGCLEFFGSPPAAFEDMDDIFSQYAGPSGIFLVLLDDDRVVGTGAILGAPHCLEQFGGDLR